MKTIPNQFTCKFRTNMLTIKSLKQHLPSNCDKKIFLRIKMPFRLISLHFTIHRLSVTWFFAIIFLFSFLVSTFNLRNISQFRGFFLSTPYPTTVIFSLMQWSSTYHQLKFLKRRVYLRVYFF